MIPSGQQGRAWGRRALLLAAGGGLLHAQDPQEILRKATSFDVENFLGLRPYVWNSEELAYRKGKLIRQQKYEINMISGAMYWRKLEQQHEPLRGKEAEQEKIRLERHLAQPRSADGLPPDQGWRFERSFLEEMPRLHRLEKFTEVVWGGTPCYYCELSPMKDARGQHPLASFFSAFRLRIWLEKTSLHWVHSQWTAARQVSWNLRQLPLGRLSMVYSNGIVYRGLLKKNQSFRWSLEKLPSGVWGLAEYQTEAGDFRNQLRYFDYRKYSSESELVVH